MVGNIVSLYLTTLVGLCFCIPISVEVLVPWLVAMKLLKSNTSDDSFEGFLGAESHLSIQYIPQGICLRYYRHRKEMFRFITHFFKIRSSYTIRGPSYHRVRVHPERVTSLSQSSQPFTLTFYTQS